MMLGNVKQNSLWAKLMAAFRNSPPMRYPELGLICVAVFVDLLGVGAITPIRAIYARDHGATMAELGLMASSFLLGGLVFQLPGGWASDKWGRKPLLVFGVAVAGIISILFLASDHPWYFIVLRFIEGAAGAAIGPAANAYVMDAVPARERGAAFGWLGSAFSAGFMLGPAAGGLMVDSLGYMSPFIFGGVTSLITAFWVMRKMKNRKPGDALLAQSPKGEDEPAAEDDSKNRRKIPSKLFAPALVGALALTAASGFGDGLFISIWTLWLNDLHASNSFIGLTFVTFSLPLMILMPVTGKMADKYRLAPLIAIPGLLISFVYLTYGVIDNLLLILGLGVLEGTFVAIMGPAVSAYIANLSPENARGRLQGVISTSRTVAGFASSMLVALLYSHGAFYPFIMLAAVQIVISASAGLMVWRIETRTARMADAEAAAGAVLAAPSAAPVLQSAAK